MPEAFERCQRAGGKIRNKDLGGGKYRPMCTLNGKTYPGYTKTKGKEENKYSKGLANHGRKSSY